MFVRQGRRLVCVLLLAGSAAACASLHARSAPVRPALEAPEPPPRTVAPIPEPDPEAAGATAPTPVVVTDLPPATRTRRPPTAKHPPEKEPPPTPPVVAPVETPPRAAADPAGGAALQTTANVTETERRVRALLARAVKDLDQLDARRLTAGAKSQYDSARRFVSQAEEALKAMNLVFAEQLADKAAALAAGLLGR